MDEAFTAWLAAHRTLHGFLQTTGSATFPPVDRLYPLYNLWILAWTNVFGLSEYALRAANIPFAGVFAISMALSSRLIFGRRFAWLPFALAPFAWFYMNEARPYMMLLALSTATIGALGTAIFGPAASRTKASWLFVWMLLFTCMTDIVAVLALPGVFVLLLVGAWNGTINARRLILRGLWLVPLFTLLIGYYAAILAAPAERGELLADARRGPSLAVVGASLYEQVGLAGLGPARNAVRLALTRANLEPYVLSLGTALLAYAVALRLSLRRRPDKQTVAFLGAWSVAILCSALLASVLDVRFLGRHMAAVLPLLLFGALGLLRSRAAILLVSAVVLVSDLRLSFLPEYGKDDYRAAATDIMNRVTKTGGEIYWSADRRAANYYGLTLRCIPKDAACGDVPWKVRATGTLAVGWSNSFARSVLVHDRGSGPIYVAVSKPDIFDTRQAWHELLLSAVPLARYQSFEIYELRRRDLREPAGDEPAHRPPGLRPDAPPQRERSASSLARCVTSNSCISSRL
jgi:hypothetical protein